MRRQLAMIRKPLSAKNPITANSPNDSAPPVSTDSNSLRRSPSISSAACDRRTAKRRPVEADRGCCDGAWSRGRLLPGASGALAFAYGLLTPRDRSLPAARPRISIRTFMVSDIQSRAILRKLRNIYARVLRPQTFGTSYENATVSGPAASELIRMRLLDPKPAMICRMGNVELRCVLTWHAVDRDRSRLAKAISYIRNRSESFWWEDVTIETMCHNAGFFPPDTESLARFSALMLDDMKEVDILGSWQRQERILDRHLAHAVKIPLPDLEPYYHREPWSSSLEGTRGPRRTSIRRSIEAQFPKRQFLFNNGFRLPTSN